MLYMIKHLMQFVRCLISWVIKNPAYLPVSVSKQGRVLVGLTARGQANTPALVTAIKAVNFKALRVEGAE